MLELIERQIRALTEKIEKTGDQDLIHDVRNLQAVVASANRLLHRRTAFGIAEDAKARVQTVSAPD